MHTAEGHRQRTKDRFRKEGLDGFGEVHALELLLFYAIPQRDTKPLARALLDRFGSMPLVLEATPEELMSVKGVGENVATYLKLVLAAGRYYTQRKAECMETLRTAREYIEYVKSLFVGEHNEVVYLVCLDAGCKVLRCQRIGEGSVTSAHVPIRRVAEVAMGTRASSVILAHNHPSGYATPSLEDRDTTEQLASALAVLGITLVDHVIVGQKDAVSLVESRMYDPRHFYKLT